MFRTVCLVQALTKNPESSNLKIHDLSGTKRISKGCVKNTVLNVL